MNYSFNLKGDDFVFAQSHDVNASYKDLGAVCDSIRYLRASDALDVLDMVVHKEHAILYRRHNKHMGSRHELGGAKGGYPTRAASEVIKTLSNAIANAKNAGKSGEDMVIVCASANKTRIERRYPSKGSLAWGRGMYGQSAINHSDIEYAKIEIVLGNEYSNNLTKNMKYFIRKRNKQINTETEDKNRKEKATAKKRLPKQADKKKEIKAVAESTPEIPAAQIA